MTTYTPKYNYQQNQQYYSANHRQQHNAQIDVRKYLLSLFRIGDCFNLKHKLNKYHKKRSQQLEIIMIISLTKCFLLLLFVWLVIIIIIIVIIVRALNKNNAIFKLNNSQLLKKIVIYKIVQPKLAIKSIDYIYIYIYRTIAV